MKNANNPPKIARGLGWQAAMALMVNILSLAMPVMMLQVYDRIIPHQSYGTLAFLCVGVLVALACDGCLRAMRGALAGRVAAAHEHVLGTQAMRRILGSELQVFEKNTAGTHLQNMNAFGKLREFYSGQALMGFIDLPFAALFLGMIAYLSPPLVIVPVVLLVVFAVLAVIAGNRLKTTIDYRSDEDERKTSILVSVLTGIHSAKAFGMEKSLVRRFDLIQEEATKASYRVALANGATTILSSTFGQLSFVLTASLGCLLVVQGNLTVGGLSACSLLAGRAMQPIQRVLASWLRVQDLALAKAQTYEILHLPQHRYDQSPAHAPQGHVSLQDVTFGYGGENLLLENVSLELAPGEVVAITGAKGSGKSTLLNLIAGSTAAQAGSITIDGLDPARQRLAGDRRYVGVMPQQGTIFQGSIIDNISGFSRDDLILAKARIAAQLLGIDEVVNLLPRGYQTLLQDNQGDPLPPGVKQRIALARVLTHQPGVLLFDDADRALDKEGYNRLFRLLGKLKGNCTMIIVSHDYNLLSFADRAYHLEDGHLKAVAMNNTPHIAFLPKLLREQING